MGNFNPNKPQSFAPGLLPGVGPDQLETAVCSNCGGESFLRISKVLIANRFQTAFGTNHLVEVPLGFTCSSCGMLNTLIAKKEYEARKNGGA